MNELDWNKERHRTRDRLIGNNLTNEMLFVYPWENIAREQLAQEILSIARERGYIGTDADFWIKNLVIGTIETFPEEGNTTLLYLDRDTGILYRYIQNEYVPVKTTGLTS